MVYPNLIYQSVLLYVKWDALCSNKNYPSFNYVTYVDILAPFCVNWTRGKSHWYDIHTLQRTMGYRFSDLLNLGYVALFSADQEAKACLRFYLTRRIKCDCEIRKQNQMNGNDTRVTLYAEIPSAV